MATQLPVPIEFELPEGWTPAPPDEVNAPGSAFVALHPASIDGFTANITIAGQLYTDGTSLDAIADESLRRLDGTADVVTLRQRDIVGSKDAPGRTQVVDITTTIDNRRLQLVQCQVYLELRDESDPRRRAVIELALTCRDSQLDAVLGDYQKFVGTVRPQAGSST
ncbi:hypothetical protein [Prauserella muralis]|uniref:Uncharacterized protein n=1 Tax=Prauserella muralis TaxID=588067 RepID=A0A2V4B724_9PSEU|nr:hypothetical protein [Prauserella muralis]PXY30946.1 hypothetical protein BAY60_00475 [Prauserella muralis]TWE14799.1 hypothetical protein FHX69_6958 [Prauserella muralis]